MYRFRRSGSVSGSSRSAIRTGLLVFVLALGLGLLFSGCDNPTSSDADNGTNSPDADNGTSEPSYAIGDTGPAGGFIFYVDGDNDHDWTYLEAAPVETEWELKRWGGYNTEVGGDAQGHQGIGDGANATAAIVTAYGANEPQYDESDYAAKLTFDLVVNHNGIEFNDWFLPSAGELGLMYDNLHIERIGDFDWRRAYWSSTELGQDGAWSLRFFDGGYWSTDLKYYQRWVRAVRAF